MAIRFNGFSKLGLESVQGVNGFLSMAVDQTEHAFGETGVVANLHDFKVLAGMKDLTENISTLPAEQRTFEGVEIADDAAYTAAYAKQANVRRLIDWLQQRAVIMASSAAKAGVAVETTNGWTKDIAAANAVTFMLQDVEGLYYTAPKAGVPADTDSLTMLADDFDSLMLFKADGTESAPSKALLVFDHLPVIA